MVIWGHGRKVVPIGALLRWNCPSCGNATTLHLAVLKKDFRLYFIPVARWNSAYYVMCGVCQASAEIDKEVGKQLHALFQQGLTPTEDQVRASLAAAPALPATAPTPPSSPAPGVTTRPCPHCGGALPYDAETCPACGRRSPAWTHKDGYWWSPGGDGYWYWFDPASASWKKTDTRAPDGSASS